jgi:hypothetical protein
VSEKAISNAKQEKVLGTETGNPDPIPPFVNIKAVNRKGDKLNRIHFTSLSGKIGENFVSVFKEKSFDTAITDVNGNTNLFYPKEGDVTSISITNGRVSQLQFEEGKIPSSIEFLIEAAPEAIPNELIEGIIEANADDIKNKRVGAIAKKSDNSK